MKTNANKVAIFAFILGGAAMGGGEAAMYYFEDFERQAGWQAGVVEEGEHDLSILQGRAEIVQRSEAGSEQVLRLESGEPFSTARLDASEFQGSREVFFEILAKPSALSEEQDEEFLDFGGAILGFFKSGGKGELQALFAKSERESVWISSGVQFPLNSGDESAEWLRIRIRMDRAAGRWDLAVNDEWVLRGLKLLEIPESHGLHLLLYGHASASNEFDDLLVSEVPPEELERMIMSRDAASERSSGGGASHIGTNLVHNMKANDSARRRVGAFDVERTVGGKPRLRGMHLALATGSRTYESRETPQGTPEEGRILAYAPEYNDDGNRLDAVLTIVADVYVEPGIDLRQLKWQIMRIKEWPPKGGEVLQRGDFATGLVQTVPFRADWQQMAVSVVVGTLVE